MKKFTLGLAALVLVSSLVAAPAMAAGITVNVNSHADNINQLALAGALAANSAVAEATNIAGLTSLTGDWTGNTNLSASVDHVVQNAGAGSYAWAWNGNANATADNIAGLVSGQVTDVDNYASIGSSATASWIAQANLAIAVAGNAANASATNIAGLDSVKVNVN